MSRKRDKTAKRLFVGITAFNVLLMIVLLVVIICKLLSMRGETNENPEVQESVDPHANQVRVDDYDFGELWFDKDDPAPKSTFSKEFLTTEGDFYAYDDGVNVATLGIDVSEFQGDIDWEAVAGEGMDFAMIRIGRRGYETGNLVEDSAFRTNLAGAKAAGLDVGVYFYSQAITPAEALEEAEFVLDLLDGENLNYPVAFDWEHVKEQTSRTHNIYAIDLTSCAKTFCDTIRQGGYVPMLYFYKSLAYYQYDMGELSEYDSWISYPRDTLNFYYDARMWQYSIDGGIFGISGIVDLDLCFRPYS